MVFERWFLVHVDRALQTPGMTTEPTYYRSNGFIVCVAVPGTGGTARLAT
jgi:GTP-binding protein EngB required for normal cell division